MIALYLFIVLFFVLYAIKNFKKSFLTFSAVSIIFNAAMALKYSPPAISCQLVISLFFAISFYYQRKTYKSNEFCFFKKSFIWCCLSLLISSLVNFIEIGSLSGLTSTIQQYIILYVFIYIFYKVCQSFDDIKYFCKIIISLFAIIFIYGLYEYITKTNPILDTIMSNMPVEYAQDKLYLSDLSNLRDGRSRCQSLFSISILYGIMSALFAFFLIYLRSLGLIKIKKIIYILLVAFSLFGCYACNSKTALVALPIFIIPLLLKNKLLLMLDVIICFVLLLIPDVVLNIIGNFIDLRAFDAKDNSVEGSSLYLRLIQLNASLELWLRSPIFGNGLRSAAMFADKGYDVFGAESVWFRLMIEQGMFGLISYLSLIGAFIKASLKAHRLKMQLLFFTIGFFVICTITDINYTMFFMCFIVLYKLDKLHFLTIDKSSNKQYKYQPN